MVNGWIDWLAMVVRRREGGLVESRCLLYDCIGIDG